MSEMFSGKRSLSKKWYQHLKKIHLEKLKNMRPMIDQSSPHDFVHLKLRKKQELQKEERFTEIERANRILYEKMSNIMNSKSPPRSKSNKRSLNSESRKKNLEKIMSDNKALLQRLRSKTPVYSSRQLDREWRKKEKIKQNVCEFPINPLFQKSNTKLISGKISLYKKGVYIDKKYYLVEIFRKNDFIKVIIFDPSISESHTLDLAYEEALDIMKGKEDFDFFVSLFKIENEDFMLINSKPSII